MYIYRPPEETFRSEKLLGYSVRYRVFGLEDDRQPIILVHGIDTSSAYFLPLAEQLAKQYTVYALDLPGYGRSPKPAHALTIEKLADILHAFTKAHKLMPILIGHSMGCQIIASYLARHPHAIKKSILLSPTVYKDERNFSVQALRLVQDSLHEPLKLNAIMTRDYLRMGIFRYLATAKYMVDDRIEHSLKDTLTKTLLLRGENDSIVPSRWLLMLKEQSSNIVLDQVSHSRHGFHYSHAHKTYGKCHNFIESK